MARELIRRQGSFGLLAVFAIAAALAGSALAQSPAAPATTPAAQVAPAKATPSLGKHEKGVNSPAFDNVRKALDALTPEQRKHFQENFLRWSNLSPEEKKALQDREEIRKKFVAQEIETAIKESGLELDAERREQFVKRYGEERRKIEEQVRKEMAEKRKPLVREMVAKLKQEFSAPAAQAAPASVATPEQKQ